MHLLDPKNDLVFKLLLTRRPELLAHMLTGILARPILRATVVNPSIPIELPTDKEIALDVRAVLDDGSRADVEMQLRVPPELRRRLVYYGARDYGDQLDRGDGYHLLEPTAVVVWLAEPLFPALGLHSIFELRERNTNTRFSDQFAIHVLQLGALSRRRATGYAAIVERWARFFVADPRELQALASEDSIMSIATQTLEELSRDPVTRRQAREHEDATKLRRMELVGACIESKREVLLKQLGIRFGPLAEAVRARLETATVTQLDTWFERAVTAETLDEILAP